MTISTKAAARKICELGGWNVTNLQLNKILYLANMVFMGNNQGEPLISGNFEAWDYGPVNTEIYHEAKKYGSKPIRMGFFTNENITGTPEEAELARACAALLSKTSGQLVGFTHRKGGAWARNYRPNTRGLIIPNHHIYQEAMELKNA